MITPPDPPEFVAADDQGVPAPATGSEKAVRSRYRDALRHRDMRLLIEAFLVDQVGSWSYFVVISVYIFDRTDSTQWLAAVAACRWGTGLLLASYGGVIADRYQRTTVLIVSALTSAVLMTGMAVVVATDAPVGLILAIKPCRPRRSPRTGPPRARSRPTLSVRRISPRRTPSSPDWTASWLCWGQVLAGCCC